MVDDNDMMKLVQRYRLLVKLLSRLLDYSEPVQHYKHHKKAMAIRKLACSILDDYESNPIEVSDD